MLTAGYKQGSKNKNKNKLIFIIILLNSNAPVLPTKAAQTKADQLVLLKFITPTIPPPLTGSIFKKVSNFKSLNKY